MEHRSVERSQHASHRQLLVERQAALRLGRRRNERQCRHELEHLPEGRRHRMHLTRRQVASAARHGQGVTLREECVGQQLGHRVVGRRLAKAMRLQQRDAGGRELDRRLLPTPLLRVLLLFLWRRAILPRQQSHLDVRSKGARQRTSQHLSFVNVVGAREGSARREELSVPRGDVSVGEVQRRAFHGRQEEAARVEPRSACLLRRA